MSTTVSWMLELAVKPGQLENFKSVMTEMIAATQSEAGTEIYEWFFNDDQSVCHIYERYSDSDAVLTHLGSFGAFAERFMGAVDPTRLTVVGNPDERVKGALADLGPMFLTFNAGFSR